MDGSWLNDDSPKFFELNAGVKVACIQKKPHFEFWILMFSWASDVQ